MKVYIEPKKVILIYNFLLYNFILLNIQFRNINSNFTQEKYHEIFYKKI